MQPKAALQPRHPSTLPATPCLPHVCLVSHVCHTLPQHPAGQPLPLSVVSPGHVLSKDSGHIGIGPARQGYGRRELGITQGRQQRRQTSDSIGEDDGRAAGGAARVATRQQQTARGVGVASGQSGRFCQAAVQRSRQAAADKLLAGSRSCHHCHHHCCGCHCVNNCCRLPHPASVAAT